MAPASIRTLQQSDTEFGMHTKTLLLVQRPHEEIQSSQWKRSVTGSSTTLKLLLRCGSKASVSGCGAAHDSFIQIEWASIYLHSTLSITCTCMSRPCHTSPHSAGPSIPLQKAVVRIRRASAGLSRLARLYISWKTGAKLAYSPADIRRCVLSRRLVQSRQHHDGAFDPE